MMMAMMTAEYLHGQVEENIKYQWQFCLFVTLEKSVLPVSNLQDCLNIYQTYI